MKIIFALATSLLLLLSLDCNGQSSESVYKLCIKTNDQEFTSIFLLDKTNDSSIGTIINEFGFKIFDLKYKDGKLKISNVIRPLDKWYVRRALRKDFQFILSRISQITPNSVIKKKRRIMKRYDGIIEIKNLHLNITYTFIPIFPDYGNN